MKRILVTERQYKKLLNSVNEQFNKFNDPKDTKDVSNDIMDALVYLTVVLRQNNINKDLYIDKIEDGIVYLDSSKYTQEEMDIIEKRIKTYVNYDKNPRDKVLPNVFGFDSGVDTDWVDMDVDNEVGTDSVSDDDSDYVDTYSGDFACIPSEWTPFFNLLSKGESKSGSYESLYPSTTISKKYSSSLGGKNPLEMTIKEVLAVIDTDGGEPNRAVGRWQFTYLRSQAKGAGLNIETDLFDKCNQDKIAMSIIEKRGVDLKMIKDNIKKAALELSKIWAALPVLEDTKGFVNDVKRGQSYYSGVGSNKSNITPEEFEKVLKNMGGNRQSLTTRTNITKKPSNLTNTSIPCKDCRRGDPHHGYDIVGPNPDDNWEIVCNNPGKVTYAGRCKTYGKFVEIQHENGMYSAYGHLKKIYVTEGQKIKIGDTIGVEGNTGRSKGRHLHFEERVTRPNNFKNRCGDGSPYNEVYGYDSVKPVSVLNNYFYFQKTE